MRTAYIEKLKKAYAKMRLTVHGGQKKIYEFMEPEK